MKPLKKKENVLNKPNMKLVWNVELKFKTVPLWKSMRTPNFILSNLKQGKLKNAWITYVTPWWIQNILHRLEVVKTFIWIQSTVVVWTQKQFTPLLTRPQGSQGCQKIRIYFLQIKVLSFCAKIAQKRHKLWKSSKLKKKCQKNPVFLDIFKYSSIWGQS